jgi:hypothetical protein
MIKLKNNYKIREKITLVNKKIFCCHIGDQYESKCLQSFIEIWNLLVLKLWSYHLKICCHIGDQYESKNKSGK